MGNKNWINPNKNLTLEDILQGIEKDFIHLSYNERIGSVLIWTGLIYALSNALTPALHIRENKLATSGQYNVTRNPVYNGFRLLSTGLAVSHPSAESVSACACVYLATEATARIEERQLENQFGERYLKYKEQVPRWTPRFVSNQIDRVGIFLLKYSPFR